MKLIFVLPCYNEQKNVKPLIEKINATCSELQYTIVAVNDGSTDKTEENLATLKNRFPLTIITHKNNRGLNQAQTSGLKMAIKIAEPTDLIVTMDADQTHDPSYIKTMMRHLHGNSDCDMIIASRYAKGGQIGVPPIRVILSLGISILAKTLFDLPAKDVTSGYRCYRARLIERIISRHGENFITAKGFGGNLELLIKANRQGAKIVEVPFILNYSKRRSKSKMKVPKTIINYTRLMLGLLVVR